MRRHLKCVSARVQTSDSSFTLIVHPLLNPPLSLDGGHNDAQFKITIAARLKEESRETDKQVVPYFNPPWFTLKSST